MGCDIHFYVEHRNDEGVWEPVYTRLETCEYCAGTQNSRYDSYCKNCEGDERDHDEVTQRCFTGPLALDMHRSPCYCTRSWAPPGQQLVWEEQFYRGRNYALFGVLSDVRGAPLDGFTEYRGQGIPYDASEAYARVADDGDAHSFTYYTLDQLLACPAFQPDYCEGTNKDPYSDFRIVLKRLREIDPDPKRVRAVFFYDN